MARPIQHIHTHHISTHPTRQGTLTIEFPTFNRYSFHDLHPIWKARHNLYEKQENLFRRIIQIEKSQQYQTWRKKWHSISVSGKPIWGMNSGVPAHSQPINQYSDFYQQINQSCDIYKDYCSVHKINFKGSIRDHTSGSWNKILHLGLNWIQLYNPDLDANLNLWLVLMLLSN